MITTMGLTPLLRVRFRRPAVRTGCVCMERAGWGQKEKRAIPERVYSISYFRAREKHPVSLPQECHDWAISAKKRQNSGFFTRLLCKLFVIIGNTRGILVNPAIIKSVCKDGKDMAKQWPEHPKTPIIMEINQSTVRRNRQTRNKTGLTPCRNTVIAG